MIGACTCIQMPGGTTAPQDLSPPALCQALGCEFPASSPEILSASYGAGTTLPHWGWKQPSCPLRVVFPVRMISPLPCEVFKSLEAAGTISRCLGE